MNNQITFHQVINCLESRGMVYGLLGLENDVTLIVSEHGGRIFGPFLTPNSASIFWMNRAFAHPDAFKKFLDAGAWNQGGDRVWIAPEIQYNVRDRADFWGSIRLPSQIDPGQYRLSQPQTPARSEAPLWGQREPACPDGQSRGQADHWRLSQELGLQAYNLASGHKQLRLERTVRRVPDPLRHVSAYRELMHGVLFAGYEQSVSLSEAKPDDIMSEAWSVIQLNPAGLLLIPASPQAEFSDYFEPIDGNLQSIHASHIRLKITGDRRYKVGYKAVHVFGRLAYFNHLDDERAYLIVRDFSNNPSAPYIEEPPHLPGCRGHSIHVYNDGGDFGGFGELECNGQTIGGVTGRSSSTDQFMLWLYVGTPDRLRRLTPHLVGVEL